MLGNLFLNTPVQFLGIQPCPTPAGLGHRASPSSPSCRVRIREGCDLFKALQPGLELRSSASQARVPSLPLYFSSLEGLPRSHPHLDLSPHLFSPVSLLTHPAQSAPRDHSILCSGHRAPPPLSAGCPLSPPPRTHCSALYPCNPDSAFQLNATVSSSRKPSGTSPSPAFPQCGLQIRGAQPLFPNAATTSLRQSYWSLLWAGICADQLWLPCSPGAHELVGKEMAWKGQMLTSLYYTQGSDSLCYLIFRNLTKC